MDLHSPVNDNDSEWCDKYWDKAHVAFPPNSRVWDGLKIPLTHSKDFIAGARNEGPKSILRISLEKNFGSRK